MIKINLLPARKKATRQSRGEQSVLIGVDGLLLMDEFRRLALLRDDRVVNLAE